MQALRQLLAGLTGVFKCSLDTCLYLSDVIEVRVRRREPAFVILFSSCRVEKDEIAALHYWRDD